MGGGRMKLGRSTRCSVDDSFFKRLSDAEEKSYRQWARENYVPGEVIDSVWHPVVRDECRRINDEWFQKL